MTASPPTPYLTVMLRVICLLCALFAASLTPFDIGHAGAVTVESGPCLGDCEREDECMSAPCPTLAIPATLGLAALSSASVKSGALHPSATEVEDLEGADPPPPRAG
ncbi:MAG: hypothetical protein AAF318_10125 [Pseudomonadota bacterium]